MSIFDRRFFLKTLFIFRERGREGERERNVEVPETHRSVAPRKPPTGDLACTPCVYPNWGSNWRPIGLQASTQSTEPPQPGPVQRLNASQKHPQCEEVKGSK